MADVQHQEALTTFVLQYNLNEDAQAKLLKLAPDVQATVMQEFRPPPGAAEAMGVNGKLIMFASSVDKRMRGYQPHGKGCGGKVVPPSYQQQPAWEQQHMAAPHDLMSAESQHAVGVKRQGLNDWADDMAPKKGKGKSSSTGWSADIPAPEAEAHIHFFCQQWALNEDAMQRLQRLPPAALEVVLRDFQPQGEQGLGADWNGKLIVFASKVEQTFRNDPMAAFVGRWNLNQDAQAKLWQLDQLALDTVLSQFRPPPGAADVNGMLIMFANSIAKGGKKGGKAKGSCDGGCGGKGFDWGGGKSNGSDWGGGNGADWGKGADWGGGKCADGGKSADWGGGNGASYGCGTGADWGHGKGADCC